MIRRACLGLAASLAAALCLTAALHAPAHADRRYFPFTYSPHLGPKGEFEIEGWSTARSGKTDPSVGSSYEHRVELEYGIHSRFRAAGYLNFSHPAGENLAFDSPSLELIYTLAEQGSLFGDPALYLEVTPKKDELEIESKILLAYRNKRWIYGSNVIGEYEFRHNDEEVLPSGKILKKEFAGELTGGVAYLLNENVSLGVESRYRSVHPNFGAQSDAFLSVGPAFSVQFGSAQFSLGVQPQIWGTPSSTGNLNLDEFEKATVRAIFGVDL